MPIAPATATGPRPVGGAWLWPLLFLVVYAAALAWYQHGLTPGVLVAPLGDHGADDILIAEAKQFRLLHGVYSRFGFYHPGPLVLQIAAFGEMALVDWLSWPSSYAVAQSFAAALLHGIALAITLRLWLLVTGNGLVALLATAIVAATIAHAGSPEVLVKYWAAHSAVAGATMPKHWETMWVETVGVIAILNRRNDHSVCIDPASWHLLFHQRYRCPEKRHPDDLVLHVLPREDATGTVIAPLLNVVLVQLKKSVR